MLTARGRTTAPALVPMALGMLLVGCNKNDPPPTPPEDGRSTTPGPVDDDTINEPMYGVPMTDDDLSEPQDDAPAPADEPVDVNATPQPCERG